MPELCPLPDKIDTRYNSVKGYLDLYCGSPVNETFFRKIVANGKDEHTYEELNSDCVHMASAMIKSGMTGKCVAFMAENRYEHFVCMFAAFLAGAIYLPLNPSQNVEMTASMLNFTDTEIIFVSERFEKTAAELKALCPALINVIGLDGSMFGQETYIDMKKRGEFNAPMCSFFGDFDDDRTAMYCFTSGTTAGKPKCVELTCKNLFATGRYKLYEQIGVLAENKRRVYYSPLPTFHLADFAFAVTYVIPLGGTCCTSNSPQDSLRDIRLLSPDFLQIVPAIAKIMLSTLESEVVANGDAEWFKAYKAECDSGIHTLEERRMMCRKYLGPVGGELIAITLAGAISDVDMMKRMEYFGISCSCDYGLTECSPLVSFDLSLYRRIGSVGRAMPYTETRVVDGVLYVRGENVMKGYYKNEEATREVLSEDGWLCTGDMAEIDDDGFIFIKGRANSIVVLSNGDNIDVDELTSRFMTLPSIEEIVIIADKKNNNDTLGALVYPAVQAGYEDVEKDIFSVNTELPIQKRIMRFRLVDKPFEKNSMMKIKRYMYVKEEI